jgi:hypothetical protein
VTANMYILPDGADEWLRSGARGISSEAIFSHLTGLMISRRAQMGPPGDPDDMRRCRLLLEQVPTFRADLHRMGEVSKRWEAIVARWDEGCALMDEEAPNWRQGYGTAARTADLMFRIDRQYAADRATREDER